MTATADVYVETAHRQHTDLPIPDYDRLRVVDIVPWLTQLGPDELDTIRRYETAHKARTTVLARIDTLLARTVVTIPAQRSGEAPAVIDLTTEPAAASYDPQTWRELSRSWTEASLPRQADPTSVPARRARGTRRLIVVVTAAALVAVGAVLAGGRGSTSPSQERRVSSPTASHAHTSPAAHRAHAPSRTKRLRAWYVHGGGRLFTWLSADFGEISRASSTGQQASLNVACQSLLADVEAAQAHDPIPSRSVQRHWGKALHEYRIGADDCIAGTTSLNSTVIGRAAREFRAGTRYLERAQNALP